MKIVTAAARRRRVNWNRTSLALAMALALCGGGTFNASAADADAFATVAHATTLRGGDAVMGALPMTQPIHVEVALRLRNEQALDALIANNAKNQMQHRAPKLLSPGQFLADHAPTPAQAQAVADYLIGKGYTNVTIAPNRLLVSADGTAASARAAFSTTFGQVRTHDGRVAFANTDAARIPAALSDTVVAIVGLQDVHRAHTFASRYPGSVHTNVLQGHFPTEFPSIYGVGSLGFVPSNVGIVSDGNLSPTLTDLDVFEANHNLAPSPYVVVNISGASGDTSDTDEWNLDSQAIVGMAGGPVTLVFYNVPNLSNASLTAAFNTVVAKDKVKIVVASVGECETDAQADGSAAADDAIFKTAVVQGQTFSIPAGDSGTSECPTGSNAPDWPAASQYVVAVSGTTLNGPTGQWSSETAWVASGGSPSTFEPMPAWQTTFGVPGATRGVPDVAFDGNPASGALVVTHLALTEVGGTGLSASLFAGAWSRVLSIWGNGFGFAGPALYALPATDFHDITSGSNRNGPAGAGYDFASGRGSVIVNGLVIDSQALANHPPVANFSVTGTGRQARFTDLSTDSDGSIVAHAWNFGDGTTSTATSPIHTYAVNGPYKVVETVTDNDGSFSKVEQAFDAGTAQLLLNTGFENNVVSWTLVRPADNIQINTDPTFVNTGAKSVLFFANLDALTQSVSLPAYKTSAQLKIHLWVDDLDSSTTATNTLQVVVTDTTDGSDHILATFTNLDGTTHYLSHVYDLAPFLGKRVVIKFNAPFRDNVHSAKFYLDDITLTVN